MLRFVVAQLAIGRHCRNFILSQSSFHVWLAYAALRPRYVLYFNDSDPVHTGIVPAPSWHSAAWIAV